MSKKLAALTIVLLLCAPVRPALALGEVIEVTKQEQARLGLQFTLVAERVDAQAVLVRMEIPRKGKLKGIRSVSMTIGSGRPIVSAMLHTSPGKNGAWVVSFQLSPEMADKCSINLLGPYEGLSYTVYAVQLKGYVTARK